MALTVLFKNQNHPIWSQDRGHHSHKYNRAGINYQLGISFAENKRIWMNSLFKAGKNDVSIFTKNGLKNRLLNLKKKVTNDPKTFYLGLCHRVNNYKKYRVLIFSLEWTNYNSFSLYKTVHGDTFSAGIFCNSNSTMTGATAATTATATPHTTHT